MSTSAPGRAGFLDVLRRMGADVDDRRCSTPAPGPPASRARYGPLRATDVGGAEVPSLIDEIPVLAVAAAYAEGTHGVRRRRRAQGEGERPHRHHGRRPAAAWASAASPARTAWSCDGGAGRPLSGGPVDSAGDHRIAMAMAVAAAGGPRPGGRVRMGRGRHQLPHVRGGLPPVRRHSHRWAGRIGQIDRRPGRGRPAGPRLPRHRGHVPGGGLRGHPPRHRP